ncbi:GDSL-type esterase/lipase family protein [Kovacikia minuta CCNUW1]|uniref:GDSL-type esterase/lipase family protein n=1 Tax=Kovacikia minuta TaxID=2931930 RepID=UPI001CCB68F6|nr:GDSL-type esterase/lipase family protein [Kovacikia minuta]UBF26282.1 GDSL-type esterase/lipase family protein [Kovacikia minuta CCNUW1]
MQTATAFLRFRPTLTSQSLRIVALGDSLIYGYGDPVGGGWVERLRRSWMEPHSPGPVLYNLGVRGDSVKQVARRLEDEFRNRGEIRNRLPDLMILSVGVNDSARLSRPQGRNFTDFDEFQTEMANLLNRAQRLCPVLFVGMVPIDEAQMPFLDCLYYNHADQYRYKEATRLACQAAQIPYLDIFSLWLERGDTWCRSQLSQDGLHPNVSGYQALLEDVLQWKPFREWVWR